MRNNQLSKEENILFELIQTVDAMTYDQIQQFLTKFLGCSENVPKYIIHNTLITFAQCRRRFKTNVRVVYHPI